MAFKLLDRARMSVSGAPGTGSLALYAATTGFQSFTAAGMSDGDTTSYLIEDGSPVGVAWEFGVGTYHSNGTISRDTVTASSAGGSTKISVTSAAVVSGIVRAEDLMAAAGTVGSTSPTVVQAAVITANVYDSNSLEATFSTPLTKGNIIVVIGVSPVDDGNFGFNFDLADVQYNNHSRTAWTVGWGYRVVQASDAAYSPISYNVALNQYSNTEFQGIALEIAGVNLAALTSSNWANGTFTGSSSSVSATATANSLDITFYGGFSGYTVTVTTPTMNQVSYTDRVASWSQRSAAGTVTITGSISGGSGGNGAFVLNLPGI